jgi:hypothetical protein
VLPGSCTNSAWRGSAALHGENRTCRRRAGHRRNRCGPRLCCGRRALRASELDRGAAAFGDLDGFRFDRAPFSESVTLRMALSVPKPAMVASTRVFAPSNTRRGATTFSTVKLGVCFETSGCGSSLMSAFKRRSLKLAGMPVCCMSEKRCTVSGRRSDCAMERKRARKLGERGAAVGGLDRVDGGVERARSSVTSLNTSTREANSAPAPRSRGAGRHLALGQLPWPGRDGRWRACSANCRWPGR